MINETRVPTERERASIGKTVKETRERAVDYLKNRYPKRWREELERLDRDPYRDHFGGNL